MRKRSCLIVGLDGFDPDVLANLIVFYRASGFNVRVSSTPHDCDLLVIQRGTHNNETFGIRAADCHVYDYAGTGTSDLHLAFPNVAKCVVITPGQQVSGRLATPPDVIRSFHPVIPELWRADATGDRQRAFPFVHIGHRKTKPVGDTRFVLMDALARDGTCHFWGNGWRDVVDRGSAVVHGPVSLHGSQEIYRQAQYAFGVMYPFQRATTISGRMWQAPLNGCPLFTEAMIPDCTLPGVQLCNDYFGALRNPPLAPGGADLVENASVFWEVATARLAALLELEFRQPGPVMLNRTYFEWVYSRHVKGSILRRVGR